MDVLASAFVRAVSEWLLCVLPVQPVTLSGLKGLQSRGTQACVSDGDPLPLERGALPLPPPGQRAGKLPQPRSVGASALPAPPHPPGRSGGLTPALPTGPRGGPPGRARGAAAGARGVTVETAPQGAGAGGGGPAAGGAPRRRTEAAEPPRAPRPSPPPPAPALPPPPPFPIIEELPAAWTTLTSSPALR